MSLYDIKCQYAITPYAFYIPLLITYGNITLIMILKQKKKISIIIKFNLIYSKKHFLNKYAKVVNVLIKHKRVSK